MNEWMRSRFMAPVYALVISFVASLLLGAAVNGFQGSDSPTSDGLPEVRFVVGGRSNNSAGSSVEELRNVAVKIYRSSGSKVEMAEDGTIPLEGDQEWPVTVCASLPAGWKAGKPEGFELANGRSCWSVRESTGVVDLVVEAKG